MIKKDIGISVVTILLVVVLGGISGMALKSIYQYYGGPEYKVDCYIKYLNQREYDKIYNLLSKDSTRSIGGKGEIEAYYKKIYERENRLVSVEKIGCSELGYKLQYQYTKNMSKENLTVVKEKGFWKINFPFATHDVEVFAPLGSKVYLDSNVLTYNQLTGKYEVENVLPGTYLLKVVFNQEGYQDYYKAICIPKESSYDVPYDTGYVKINCAPQLKVSLNQFTKKANGKKVEFKDILLGQYTVKVEDEMGYFETQEEHVEIDKGNNTFNLQEFILTEKGEEKLTEFIKTFYKQYVASINNHSNVGLDSYFVGMNKQEQLDLFSKWYIDLKDIQDVEFNIQLSEPIVDELGQIHLLVRETAELCNKEYDEILEKEDTKCYQVILDFETTINVLEADWKITNRKIIQSIVAIKDQEGRWVQY